MRENNSGLDEILESFVIVTLLKKNIKKIIELTYMLYNLYNLYLYLTF